MPTGTVSFNVFKLFFLRPLRFKVNPLFFPGWERLHGSDEGCRKSGSWDSRPNPGLGHHHLQSEDEDGAATEEGVVSSGQLPPPPPGKMKTSQTTTTCSVTRQLSTSSDSKLLDDEINEEVRVILRPKKPPRPKSEVFLDKAGQRKSKRYSAFGVR